MTGGVSGQGLVSKDGVKQIGLKQGVAENRTNHSTLLVHENGFNPHVTDGAIYLLIRTFEPQKLQKGSRKQTPRTWKRAGPMLPRLLLSSSIATPSSSIARVVLCVHDLTVRA